MVELLKEGSEHLERWTKRGIDFLEQSVEEYSAPEELRADSVEIEPFPDSSELVPFLILICNPRRLFAQKLQGFRLLPWTFVQSAWLAVRRRFRGMTVSMDGFRPGESLVSQPRFKIQLLTYSDVIQLQFEDTSD